jgi:hypothetical protein
MSSEVEVDKETLTENQDPQVPLGAPLDPTAEEPDQEPMTGMHNDNDDDDGESIPSCSYQVGKDPSDSDLSAEDDNEDAEEEDNDEEQDDDEEQEQAVSVEEKENGGDVVGTLLETEASAVIAQAHNTKNNIPEFSEPIPPLSPSHTGLGNPVLVRNISLVAPTTDGILSVVMESSSQLMVQGYYDANGELPSAPKNYK